MVWSLGDTMGEGDEEGSSFAGEIFSPWDAPSPWPRVHVVTVVCLSAGLRAPGEPVGRLEGGGKGCTFPYGARRTSVHQTAAVVWPMVANAAP